MSKNRETTRAIANAHEDLNLIKENAAELAHNVKEVGLKQVSLLSDKMGTTYVELKKQGIQELDKVQKRIKAHPQQSVAIAFAAGVVVSFLLRRK